MKISDVLSHVSADGLRALVATMPEAQLRAAVTAALAAPEGDATPAAVAAVQAAAPKGKAPKAPAAPKAPPVAPAAAAPKAPNALDVAIMQLAPFGFAAGELATAAGAHPKDTALRSAIQRALKNGTLYQAGEKRYARYGASPQIALNRSTADRNAGG